MDQRASHTDWNEGQGLLAEDNERPDSAAQPATRFSFEEICYVFFRHKWKILLFTLLGLMAAAGVYHYSPRLYRSEAKIMVKYITEMEPLGVEGEGQVRSPVLRGETVVNSELEILTSMDVAVKVAEAVGPERILAKLGGGNDLVSAALVVNGGTQPDVPRHGNVIRVVFQHPDPTVVRPVLSNLLDQYFLKHHEIHQALASLDDFAEQRKEVQQRLSGSETKLLQMRKTNQVFSLENSKRAASEQVFRVQQQLNDAETDLAAREAAMKALNSGTPSKGVVTDPKTREAQREQYNDIVGRLDLARRRKFDALGQYKEGGAMVLPLQKQIDELEKQKREIEAANPELFLSSLGGTAGNGTGADGYSEVGRIAVLKARIQALRESLERARKAEEKLYEVEAPMVQAQRTRDLEEKKFTYLSSALEQAQIDSGLGASRISNISRVQEPTPARRDIGALYKRVAGCALGGAALGVLLAVLLEFFVDQSVKRPVEVQRLMRVPIFISIPKASKLGRNRLTDGKENLGGGSKPLLGSGSGRGAEAYLQPYLEALRDRILNRFEGLARKPKLVGVCGCLPGSGATSIAAGLASSLSEAGDLKVLLVDMKRGQGTPHPFLAAHKSCTLIEALDGPKRQEALIAPNLYLASANGSGSHPVMSSPRKFTSVVPQLNTSDYDYIVFDLPPVNEVSITPRLAKHMDLTLLVIEAERTHRGRVQQAGSLLLEFTKNVAVVLNKTRSYLPGPESRAA